jgi:hypothetical protein
MPMIRDWLNEPAIAGALGGMIRWMTLRERWKDGLISIGGGAVCANYLRSFIQPIFEPLLGKIFTDEASMIGITAFLVGVAGIGLTGFIIDFVRFAKNRGGA